MELLFLAILIVLMIAALGSGFPVAFALPGSAIISVALAAAAGEIMVGDSAAYFRNGGPIDWLTAGVSNFRGVYWDVDRDTLIAIPLFIFMGIMLQRSKIAEDLLVTMAQLFGPVPGGLGISVVFVGALLAATTGIVGATVVAMGLISLPAMMRNNYSSPLATGTIAASGTLGQIIPPSIVLIILADQLSSAVDQASTARKELYKSYTGNFSMPSEFGLSSASAGDLFLGAMIPGLVLVALYMLFILVIAMIRPSMAPSVPFEGKRDAAFWGRVLLTLVPPLTLIFVVLGSIITGIATVNQAGAIGAAGAAVMAGYRLMEGRRHAFTPAILAIGSLVAIGIIVNTMPTNIKSMTTSADVMGVTLAAIATAVFMVSLVWSTWRTFLIEDTLRGVMIETAKTTSLVFIILLGAAMLTAAFRAFGGEELVQHFLNNLPGGFWAQFIIVMLVIFLLGFFLDFIEIAVVVVPIVAPILLVDPGANVTAMWLGVMIGLNIQTSFLTPPFGFALFYLRGVAPAEVKTTQIYAGVVPFIALQLLALAIVGITPQMVNYLPTRMSLLSDTAPPPANPRLQGCIEQYTFERYDNEAAALRSAIQAARGLDYSMLPQALQKSVTGSFEKAEDVFNKVKAVRDAEATIASKVDAYKPRHIELRDAQARILRVERELKELNTDLIRTSREDAELRARIEANIKAHQEDKERLTKQIPASLVAEQKAFAQLMQAEVNARRLYRRTADDAYTPIQKLTAALDDTPALAALGEQIRALEGRIGTDKPQDVSETVNTLGRDLGAVEGASEVRNQLSKVRRALTGSQTPNPDAAKQDLAKTIEMLGQELAWRQKAVSEIKPKLDQYDAAIRETIGLRQLPKLPREQALFVAGCLAGHEDISLSF